MKIGILAGTFDPVHIGHVAFAKKAIEQFKLDKVLLMPERQPRHKQKVSAFTHRLAMARLAAASEAAIAVFDSREKTFSLSSTLPILSKRFKEAEVVIIIGSDVARTLPDWKGIDNIRPQASYVVALRAGDSEMSMRNALSGPSVKPKVVYYHSQHPNLTSSRVRSGEVSSGIKEVDRYIAEHRLYL